MEKGKIITWEEIEELKIIVDSEGITDNNYERAMDILNK